MKPKLVRDFESYHDARKARLNAMHEFIRTPWGRVALYSLTAVIGFILFRQHQQHPMHWNAPPFKSITIHARIQRVLYYDRGTPRVILSDSQNVRLEVGGTGNKYVQAGDSIVKRAKTDSVTVYRTYPTYTEVRVYGDNGHGGTTDLDGYATGLIQRYRLPRSAPQQQP